MFLFFAAFPDLWINGTLKTTTSQNILFYDYESAENEMTEENMQNDSSTLKIFGLSLTMLLILLISSGVITDSQISEILNCEEK